MGTGCYRYWPHFFHQDHHLLSNLGIRSGTTPERFANPTGSSGASTPTTVKTGLCLGQLKLGEWLCLLLFAGHGEIRGAGFVGVGQFMCFKDPQRFCDGKRTHHCHRCTEGSPEGVMCRLVKRGNEVDLGGFGGENLRKS